MRTDWRRFPVHRTGHHSSQTLASSEFGRPAVPHSMGRTDLVRVADVFASAVYTIEQIDWLFPVRIL